MTLRERAAERGGQTNGRPREQRPPQQMAPAADGRTVAVPDYDDDPVSPDPEKVPVHIAWARVMRDVRAIAKGGFHDAPGARFRFRGVEDVDGALSNSVRKHGLLILPDEIMDVSYRDTTTTKGNKTRECTLTMRFRVIGPAGDGLLIVGAGESLDSGDKGTSKAMSIARRNALIAALTVPSGLPEPESVEVERGHTFVTPLQYRDEITHPDTSLARLVQIKRELREAPQTAAALVPTPTGADMSVWNLLGYVGKAREESRDPWPETVPGPTADGEKWPDAATPGGA